MKPELSVIIAVLDSHGVVKRQLAHFAQMGYGREVQFVIVDDGSDPMLGYDEPLPYNFMPLMTGDKRPWSQPCARNFGAFANEAKKFLFTDIDHILTKEAIDFCLKSDADKVMFPRKWGVLSQAVNLNLDQNIVINTEKKTLFEYGLKEELYEERGLSAGMHHNTFMMRSELFYKLDGYDESFCGKYGGDDTDLSRRYSDLVRVKKEARPHVTGPPIYVYPDPNKDVLKIFHSLRR